MRKFLFSLPIILFLSFTNIKAQTNLIDKFEAKTFTYGSFTLPYRIFIPEITDLKRKYPLILALHGTGECGSDNLIHIKNTTMATTWVDSVSQVNNPCFVIAPQCPDNYWWGDTMVFVSVINLVDTIIKNYSIDTNRYYVTGISMGGYGTWLMSEYFYDRIAAAVPMSAGWWTTNLNQWKHLPLWEFHGQADLVVPVDDARYLMTGFEAESCHVIYTKSNYRKEINLNDNEIINHIKSHSNPFYSECPGIGHGNWSNWYNEPLLHQWLFSKYRLRPGAIVLKNLNLPNTHPVLSGSYTLNWSSQTPDDSVEIWFSSNNGNSWNLIQSVSNNGSYDWNISTVEDCSLGKVRLLLKDSSQNVYGIDESIIFTINNTGVNGSPLIYILSQEFIQSSTINLDSINLTMLIADPENDLVTIKLSVSYDNGRNFANLDSFTAMVTIDTISRIVKLKDLKYSTEMIIKAEVSDNFSTFFDSTLHFVNNKGLISRLYNLIDDGSELNTYPNPCNDILNIKLNPAGNHKTTAYIVDIEGKAKKMIQNDKVTGDLNIISINISDLEKGTYVLILDKGEGKIYSKKIIVN